MTTKQATAIRQIIRKMENKGDDGQTSDRDLLHSFTKQHNEEAFAVLMRRHASMVMGVGQRVLRHFQDAEDVCQATFLLLAQKASMVTWRDSVASWLYEVAYHLALKARDTARRRNARELRVESKEPPDPMADINLRDLQAVIDEELNRIPKKYRALLVLCCLEGKTRDEAAQSLGLPLATVKDRLEKGRVLLRRRLAHRNLPLSIVIAGITLFSDSAHAVVPATLVKTTSLAAISALAGQPPARGVSTNAAALVKEGVHTMLLPKFKVLTVLLLTICIGAIGVGALSYHTPAQAQAEVNPQTELRARDKNASEDRTVAASDDAISNDDKSRDAAMLAVTQFPQADKESKVVLPGQVPRPEESSGDWIYPVTYKEMPAVGVKVGLTIFNYTDPAKPYLGDPVFATTDGKGEARFAKLADKLSSGGVVARDKDGRGGYGSIHGTTHYPKTIELRENSELSGRVLDEAGQPIAGLKLKPIALGPESFTAHGGRAVILARTSEWFWADFPVKLAADGAFTVTGVPVGHSVGIRFEAPGFGSGQFWVLPGSTQPIKLRRSGAIRIKFTVPPEAKPADISITAIRTKTPDWLEVTVDSTAKSATETLLTGLPPGDYNISFPYRNASFYPKAVSPVSVRSGETVVVGTSLEPAARIAAQLVDSKTGKGVAGAKMSASITCGSMDSVSIPEMKANSDGKIEIYAPSGMVQVTPMSIDGYAVSKFGNNPFDQFSTEPIPIAAGQTHDFGTFTLVKTVELTGVVLDQDEKPIAGAEVLVGYSGTNYGTVPEKTNAEGSFVIRGLNPEGGVVGVTAHKGYAITAAPVGVDPGKPEGELRVIISPRHAAYIRLRALDRAGKPIAGATIELMHSVRYLSLGGGVTGHGMGEKVGQTGDDGRFTSNVLQPGDNYTVTLMAPGYRGAKTAEWIAKPGETHDFGDMVLIRSNLVVRGIVTDLTGKPVPGATVFDNADGANPAETKTDGNGRFTLAGLYEGLAFVSVRAEGYSLTSVRAEPGGQVVPVTLRKRTDPPAAPPTISEAHKAATEKLARHVLNAMWENRLAAGDNGRSALRGMAQFDQATARKWRDDEKARTNGKSDLTTEIEAGTRDVNLLKTAKEDVDEAVALLKTVTGVEGFRAVCSLAEELLPNAPAKALRIAEEAVARARGLEEAERSSGLAQAGELVFRSGKTDAGRKLIEEASRLVSQLGFSELDGYRRGMVACRVALYDLAKCRAMIDPMKEARDFNRWLSQGCARAALNDLATAKKWFADFRPDNSFARHSARQFVAYRIVGSKPNEAIEVARGIEDRTVRACTLAGIALRLKDRGQAAGLLESAIDGIIADPHGYYNGGGGGTAAIVLYRAKQFGHPDLAGLRDKVLAARTPSFENHSTSLDAVPTFILALAVTDPETARTLLARELPASERANLDGLLEREALIALMLCEPVSTAEIADAVLARAIKAKKGYDHTGLDTLAKLLSRPDRLAEEVIGPRRLVADFKEE